jgi:hypothetical protein
MKGRQRPYEVLQVSHSFVHASFIDYKRDGHQAGYKNRAQKHIDQHAGAEERSDSARQFPVARAEAMQDDERKEYEQSQTRAQQGNFQTSPAAVGDIQS